MSAIVGDCDTRRPPHDDHFDNLPPCRHCGEAFEDHWKDSEPAYMCKEQMQTMYGYFCGGDPRDFHPDGEDSNSPEEIANHKAACELAEKEEAARKLKCPSGWIVTPEFTAHVLCAPFGIGVTTFKPTYYEPQE